MKTSKHVKKNLSYKKQFEQLMRTLNNYNQEYGHMLENLRKRVCELEKLVFAARDKQIKSEIELLEETIKEKKKCIYEPKGLAGLGEMYDKCTKRGF